MAGFSEFEDLEGASDESEVDFGEDLEPEGPARPEFQEPPK